jgi:hypothetical protein
MSTRFALFAVLLMGCSADDGVATGEDDLQAKADEEWFYNGAMPVLDQPAITVSLEGNTARLSGLLPLNATAPNLANVKSSLENGRTRIDAVYPIATARAGKSNSKPGTYSFYYAMPYRPNGQAWTPEEGNHFVTWGGFPFVAYNDGIAFHGPITETTSNGISVWLLKRGDVSGGCNRMNGEHVIELAHAIGIDMKRAYLPNASFVPKTKATVKVISAYDQYDGKYIDVDYPTDVGVTRPGKIYGDANVEMFGSWVASELPNGKDLPASLKWEGGVSGQYYVFAEHAVQNAVCSVGKSDLPKLRTWIAQRGGEVPADFCAKKACYVTAVRNGTKPGC